MAITRRRRNARPVQVHTTRTKPSLLSRLKAGPGRKRQTYQTTTTTVTTQTTRSAPSAPTYHATAGTTPGTHRPARRRPSVGDKVSGALMKLRGALTRRPGLKVCSFFFASMYDADVVVSCRLLARDGCMAPMVVWLVDDISLIVFLVKRNGSHVMSPVLRRLSDGTNLLCSEDSQLRVASCLLKIPVPYCELNGLLYSTLQSHAIFPKREASLVRRERQPDE